MPAGQGESCLVTLFGDVHYYFNDPTAKPQHHRFSKASYVYLFYNAAEHRGKLEIANHAGTPDQDAFSGYFSNVSRLNYSYRQPTLVTLTVDGSSIQGHDQWHLPSYNERNEQKYLYKIHTVDIYLWTEKDAVAFLGHLKVLLPADKQDIRDAPSDVQSPAEHRDSMSPVVQQLERTAIGQNYPPRSGSTTSAMSLPGPPTPATSSGGVTASPQSVQGPAPMAYNPAAPAAPEPIAHREKTPPPMDGAAGTGLQGAAQYDTQYANVPNVFHNSNQTTPQQAYFSSPPPQQQQQQQHAQHPSITSFQGPPTQGTPPQSGYTGQLPPPPPPPSSTTSPPGQQPYNPSFAPPPGQGQTSPPPNQTTFNRHSTFGPAGPPGQTQYATYVPQKAPTFGPSAVASPGMQSPYQQQAGTGQNPPTPSAPPAYSSPGIPPPPAQLQNYPQQQGQQTQQGQQGVFGYSNYSYTGQQNYQGYQPNQPQVGYTGDIHSQAYRPTEGEAGYAGTPGGVGGFGPTGGTPGVGGAGVRPQPQQRQNSETRTKLEGHVRNVEGKVGGYLKKLDKLW